VSTVLVHWNGQTWKTDLGAQIESPVDEITTDNSDATCQPPNQ